MTQRIHPTAIVDPTASVGNGVEIGPYSVVGAHVEIGDNTVLGPHVVLEDRTILGSNCQVSPGAVLGGPPQDLAYQGEPTRVRIGNNTHIRECVTVNRATGEGKETVVGDNCLLMAYSHLGHNCQVGNHVILANAAQIAGHVQLNDYVFIGGSSVIHQHCRVGRYAILGGFSATRMDLPPFSLNDARPSVIRGINTVGLKRRGFTLEQRQRLKRAFIYLWFSDLNLSQAIEAIHHNLEVDEYIEELLEFIHTSKRGFNAKAMGTPQGDMTEDIPDPEPATV